MKRLVDLIVSTTGIVLLLPLFPIVGLLIKLETKGPVFFKHERIGKNFKPFYLYKFRTMAINSDRDGPALTVAGDKRITRIGGLLRRRKIDELPQLINVLKGEMSLVGPRPEVQKYVDLYRKDYEEILGVRPGITDMASIRFRDEGELLSRARAPERFYGEVVLPEKIHLAKRYVRETSFLYDLKLIFLTIVYLVLPRHMRNTVGEHSLRPGSQTIAASPLTEGHATKSTAGRQPLTKGIAKEHEAARAD